MSHDVGVWIDHKKAVIVSIAAGQVTTRTLESEVRAHPRYSAFQSGDHRGLVRGVGRPRAVQRSRGSNERVVHPQEVLTAIETVLATIVDADTAVRSGVSSADARKLAALGQTARPVDADIGRLAAPAIEGFVRGEATASPG